MSSDDDMSYDSEEAYQALETSDDASDYEEISSDSDDDSFFDQRCWCKIDCNAEHLVPAPPRFPFSETPGIQCNLNDDMNSMGFFNLYFDDELLDLICTETNRCAQQNNATWNPVTSAELRVFFALKMLQGIVKKPIEDMYWSKHPLLETPIYAKTMPFRRYKKIRQYLHFSNNDTFDPETHPHPKLNNIYEVYCHLENKFRTLYLPDRDVAIDESLMLYKGRLGWIQYMPLKRSRF